jgi:hypothetical protein
MYVYFATPLVAFRFFFFDGLVTDEIICYREEEEKRRAEDMTKDVRVNKCDVFKNL